MKLKDVILTKTKRYQEKIEYGLAKIEEKEGELLLYETKVKELKEELEALKDCDPKDIKLPMHVGSAVFVGNCGGR